MLNPPKYFRITLGRAAYNKNIPEIVLSTLADEFPDLEHGIRYMRMTYGEIEIAQARERAKGKAPAANQQPPPKQPGDEGGPVRKYFVKHIIDMDLDNSFSPASNPEIQEIYDSIKYNTERFMDQHPGMATKKQIKWMFYSIEFAEYNAEPPEYYRVMLGRDAYNENIPEEVLRAIIDEYPDFARPIRYMLLAYADINAKKEKDKAKGKGPARQSPPKRPDEGGPSRKPPGDEGGPSRKPPGDEGGPSRKSAAAAADAEVPAELKVKNPLTGKMIKIGGKVYRDLVARGVIKVEPVPLKKAEELIAQEVPKCEAKEYIINPQTNRRITKGGPTYIKLLNAGVKFNDHDLPIIKKIIAVDNRASCKNRETFLAQEPVEDIDPADFLQTPSGYCFSVQELLDWVNSGTFDNRNPHNQAENPFVTVETLKQINKHPELVEALNKYFKHQELQRKFAIDKISQHVDVLYKIGETGRICYYDNVSSTEAGDSGAFEYSVAALAELSEMIHKLPADIKTAFEGLKSEVLTVKNIVESANAGTMCIHGVGIQLIGIFVAAFMALERMHHTVYDPHKTGMYFVKDTAGNIVIHNIELRLVFNSTDVYYGLQIKSKIENAKNSPSLIWTMKDIITKGLAPIFEKECPNEAYMSTKGSVDEWKRLPEWRKMRTEDGFCFDLLFLTQVVTNQLNVSMNTNPFPTYPTNIFTNKPLSMKDLLNLRRRLINNFITVAPCLLKFLFNSDILWTDDRVYAASGEWKAKLINLFEKDMRLMRQLESNDAEDIKFQCMWVDKTAPTDANETKIIRYLQTADATLLRGMRRYVIPDDYYYKNNYTGNGFIRTALI